MSKIDIFFLILVAVIIVRAGLRGFVEEVTGTAWIIAGFLFALFFYPQGAAFLRGHFFAEMPYLPEILAFILLFFIVFVASRLLGALLKDVVRLSGLSAADKMLGVLFGALEGGAVAAILIVLIQIQPLFDGNSFLQDSFAVHLLQTPVEIIKKIGESIYNV